MLTLVGSRDDVRVFLSMLSSSSLYVVDVVGHLRSNVHQKKGPSALHVRTNTCFTRCACVKERVKLIVEWKEMYYQ